MQDYYISLDVPVAQEITELFSQYILNPKNIDATSAESLTYLSNQFPYCQLLHAFVALLSNATASATRLSKAALYAPHRMLFHALVHRPGKFSSTTKEINNTNLRIVLTESLEPQAISPRHIETTDCSLETQPPIQLKETVLELDLDKEIEHYQLSKYDDTSMPFSFLWWLNKTRREHALNDQPHVKSKSVYSPSTKNHSIRELNSQIIENIFYQQAPLKKLEFQEIPEHKLTLKRKEKEVIDRFIKEEPHITSPKPEYLSTENKARKSAQDLNDLVSETLAQIYTKQMLIDKAIDTYKKLSLKFPEKSPYFDGLIHTLEQNLNK